MGTAIEVRGLTKAYGDFQAVRGIDLDVDRGEILAFLGPNGAGKTTTIEILEGYRERDGGEVLVLGVDPAEAPLSWRDQIGIVLQESEPVPELTALESVAMHAAYYANPRPPAEVLEIVGLADSADQRTRKLSGGQKRRLDLALALVGNPALVFLDEPTTGFDPSARRESWDMIDALRDFGSTVLLTTHYMDEAEHLADRIVVIAGGRIAARGTAADLARQVGASTTIRWRAPADAAEPPPGLGARPVGDGAHELRTDDVVPTLHTLTGWALDHGVDLTDVSVNRPTLEDVYLALTDDDGPGAAGAAETAVPLTGPSEPSRGSVG
ncbi:MAG: ABC transporter ATP-binding protein [Actinomycetota bacterium]